MLAWLSSRRSPAMGPQVACAAAAIDACPPSTSGAFIQAERTLAPPGVFAEALDPAALLRAWERVRDNDGCAGFDRQTLVQFGTSANAEISRLLTEVQSGAYRPQPLQGVVIPKRSGGSRQLAMPAVRDRVLQTAVANAVSHRLEPVFDDASFAYRPGRSVAQAVSRVSAHRDAGLVEVVDADIENFFDRMDHRHLLDEMARHFVGETRLLSLVQLWLQADLRRDGAQAGALVERGALQGSPLSPVLRNLYLHPVDAALRAAGIPLVRYADDLLLLCAEPAQARSALGTLKHLLAERRLVLNEAKTRLTCFRTGFQFLGVRFLHGLVEPATPGSAPWLDAGRGPATRYLESLDPALAPPDEAAEIPADGVAAARREPAFHTLYVTEPGALVTREHDRVVVSVRREVKASIPIGQLDQIAVLDNALVSTALLRRCAERGVAVAFGGHGEDIATIDRGALPDQALVGCQWEAQTQTGLGALLARQFIEGKLHNSRTVLRRFSRRDGRDALHEHLLVIDDCSRRLGSTDDLSTMRGLEGLAARHHFEAMRSLLPEDVQFPARERRPPADPVNAMLSLGYQVLAVNVHTAVRLQGLNPRLGHLHQGRGAGMALVSDLMEEFRAVAVDAVVLALWRQSAVRLSDFALDPMADAPCRLLPAARGHYIRALEARLDSPFTHPRLGTATDLRRAMVMQVQHYRDVLLRREAQYRPLKFR